MIQDVVLGRSESEAAEFTVLFWKVDQGERVAEGDELLVLESDEEKTAVSIVAPCDGVLEEIVAGEESKVAPGALLGRIETA